MRGTYVLLIRAPYDFTLKIGGLGKIPIKAGYYAYVGSALGGLKGRIGRHLKREKTLHWHIDYLLSTPGAEVVEVITTHRAECELSQLVANASDNAIDHFGCSDCNCRSHLHFFSKMPARSLITGWKG